MTLFSKNSGRIRRALITAFSVLAPAALGLGFAAAKAEAPADIVAPETGFNSVVWYAFEDEADLGKDTTSWRKTWRWTTSTAAWR